MYVLLSFNLTGPLCIHYVYCLVFFYGIPKYENEWLSVSCVFFWALDLLFVLCYSYV